MKIAIPFLTTLIFLFSSCRSDKESIMKKAERNTDTPQPENTIIQSLNKDTTIPITDEKTYIETRDRMREFFKQPFQKSNGNAMDRHENDSLIKLEAGLKYIFRNTPFSIKSANDNWHITIETLNEKEMG